MPTRYACAMLSVQTFDGPVGIPPCLIVHGLFGSGRNWGVIAKRLSATRPVLTVDMRNHGTSPWTSTHSYDDLAADLSEVLDTQNQPCDVLGHSMGGKAAMMFALRSPQQVNRLLIADIAPVAYSHSQQKMIDAMRAVDLSKVSRRSEAAAQLGDHGVEPALQSFFTQSLDITAKRWRYNLDTLEADMPKIMGFPEVSGQYDGPTLFLSGAQSDYVQRDHRNKIKSLFPNAHFAKIPGAGHWLHADKPREFQASVEAFFA